MDAIKFMKENKRMCKSKIKDCRKCPVSTFNNGIGVGCYDFKTSYTKEYVAIVEKWSNENPQKTVFDKVLEAFPNANVQDEEKRIYGICPKDLGIAKSDYCAGHTCVECWAQPYDEICEHIGSSDK